METEERVACPWCAEQIMPAAIVCPHCQRNTGFVAPPPKEPTHSGLSAAVIVALVLAGDGARDVASRNGVSAQRLHGKVMAARRFAKVLGAPAAAETEAGAPPADVAPAVSEQDRPAEVAAAPAAGESPAPTPVAPEPAPGETAVVPAVLEVDDEVDDVALPWTVADDARLLRTAIGTNDLDDIADALDRNSGDVEDRLEALCPAPRNRTTIGAALRELTGQIEPDWLSLCGRIEKGAALADIAAEAGVEVEALRDRLERRKTKREVAEAYAARWTTQNDFLLAQAIIGGPRGAEKAATALGITKAEALARWDVLMPRKGIAEQGALLRRLRSDLKCTPSGVRADVAWVSS